MKLTLITGDVSALETRRGWLGGQGPAPMDEVPVECCGSRFVCAGCPERDAPKAA